MDENGLSLRFPAEVRAEVARVLDDVATRYAADLDRVLGKRGRTMEQ